MAANRTVTTSSESKENRPTFKSKLEQFFKENNQTLLHSIKNHLKAAQRNEQLDESFLQDFIFNPLAANYKNVEANCVAILELCFETLNRKSNAIIFKRHLINPIIYSTNSPKLLDTYLKIILNKASISSRTINGIFSGNLILKSLVTKKVNPTIRQAFVDVFFKHYCDAIKLKVVTMNNFLKAIQEALSLKLIDQAYARKLIDHAFEKPIENAEDFAKAVELEINKRKDVSGISLERQKEQSSERVKDLNQILFARANNEVVPELKAELSDLDALSLSPTIGEQEKDSIELGNKEVLLPVQATQVELLDKKEEGNPPIPIESATPTFTLDPDIFNETISQLDDLLKPQQDEKEWKPTHIVGFNSPQKLALFNLFPSRPVVEEPAVAPVISHQAVPQFVMPPQAMPTPVMPQVRATQPVFAHQQVLRVPQFGGIPHQTMPLPLQPQVIQVQPLFVGPVNNPQLVPQQQVMPTPMLTQVRPVQPVFAHPQGVLPQFGIPQHAMPLPLHPQVRLGQPAFARPPVIPEHRAMLFRPPVVQGVRVLTMPAQIMRTQTHAGFFAGPNVMPLQTLSQPYVHQTFGRGRGV